MAILIGTSAKEKFNGKGTYEFDGTNWVLVSSDHTTAGRDLVRAGGGDDVVFTGAGADIVRAGAGDDLVKGGAGADILRGGLGIDTLFYKGSDAGVTVNLRKGTGDGGAATGDVISGFENITGTKFGDKLIGNGKDNTLIGGAGDDIIKGGAGGDILRGGRGNDTLIYLGSKNGVTVDLGNRTASGGHATGDVIFGFENVTGSRADDTLIGNGRANKLFGMGGNDTIRGGGGADVLRGGVGFDTVSYVGSGAAVIVDLSTNKVSGGDATGDKIRGFENIVGSAFDDTLTGNSGNNIIRGGAGGDVMDGGSGFDTVSYLASSGAVTVDLSTNTVSGGDATGDSILSFENIIGSRFADTLTGDGGNNVINGGDGGDTMDGGGGFDTLSYAGSDAAVTVDLAAGTASGGDAAGDVFTSFENLIGSNFDDTLTGNASGNIIEGGDGADTMDGAGGSDTLSYEGSDAAVIVNLGSGSASGGDADGDVISNFENLIGSDFDDTLTGSGTGNNITGGKGADTLTGNGGNDTFTYEKIADRGDTITDFSGGGAAGGDRIDLSAIDAVQGGSDDSFAFGGTTATANGVWYAVSGGNVTVFADTDGDTSTVEFSITLNGVGSLIAGDFLL